MAAVIWRGMTESQKHVREYLAKIGRRGGLASRRELTKSHARQMIAIREMKRGAQGRETVATARSQTA